MGSGASLAERVDLVRLEASRRLDATKRAALGQYVTPTTAATLMASMIRCVHSEMRVLDARAGVGSLSAALVDMLLSRAVPPESVQLDAWELDTQLHALLVETLRTCEHKATTYGVRLQGFAHHDDFVAAAARRLDLGIFRQQGTRYHAAILNPPYLELARNTPARRALARRGVEVSNLYAAFVSLAIELLEPGGELVAITPHSLCNGP
jgi:adenine-specific DNA-methyltransferase